MGTRAASMLKLTFLTFLDLPQILTRLLQKQGYSEKDIESQVPSCQLTFEDEILSAPPGYSSRNSMEANGAYQDEEDPASGGHESDFENTQSHIPYAEGPACVFLHNDGNSRDFLALSVTEEMVSMIQKVASHKTILRKHEKIYAKLTDRMSSVERTIRQIEENIAKGGGEDETEKLRQDIECRGLKLQKACTERDVMGDRLTIFRMNVNFAKDAAQSFFEQSLGDADLLDPPSTGSPTTEGESEGTARSRHNASASSGGASESPSPSPEELLRQAAWGQLMDRSRELHEIQERFDTWPGECDRVRQDYDDCLANGELVPTRSDLDQNLLQEEMGITSQLIHVEKEHEMAKEYAIAIGAVDEDWGQPMYYGDEFEAQSWGDEEEIAHQKKKDWSRVEAWRLGVSAAEDERAMISIDHTEWANGAACLDETMSEPMDIDDWDAESIDFAQDSISVVAHDEFKAKNISRWQEMTGHR